MLKIMIYAAMNGVFSSRAIETACHRDMNFMYLLEGMPAPDNSTIARFVSLHLSRSMNVLIAAGVQTSQNAFMGITVKHPWNKETNVLWFQKS
ncbi:transposase [[Clostridium] aminophilum]